MSLLNNGLKHTNILNIYVCMKKEFTGHNTLCTETDQ